MTENFKTIVRARLGEAGILVNEVESIFSPEKMIQSENESSLMLVSPDRRQWVFIGGMMSEDEIISNVDRFVTGIKSRYNITTGVSINPNISLKDYVEGIARLFGGTVPSTKLATTPLSELSGAAVHGQTESTSEEK